MASSGCAVAIVVLGVVITTVVCLRYACGVLLMVVGREMRSSVCSI